MIRRQTKKTLNHKQTQSQSSHKLATHDARELTFIEHIYELRSRLFWVVASLLVTSSVGYHFKDQLVSFIVAPLNGEKLVYLTPGGGFSFIFTICLYFGALFTIPVVIYHIYRFLQPVLGKTSRRFVSVIILLSGLLATAGASFGYLAAIPGAIGFLTTFAGDAVLPSLTADSYLGFVVAYILGLAVLFQLPLLLFMIDHVRPFPPGALLSSQRFVIVGSFIAAAIITPTPDIINQLTVAIPIIAIYQLGAVAVFVRHRARRGSHRRMLEPIAPSPERVQQARTIAREEVPELPVAVTRSSLAPTSNTSYTMQSSRIRSIDGVKSGISRGRVIIPASRNSERTASRRSSVIVGSNGQNTSAKKRVIRSMDGILSAA